MTDRQLQQEVKLMPLKFIMSENTSHSNLVCFMCSTCLKQASFSISCEMTVRKATVAYLNKIADKCDYNRDLTPQTYDLNSEHILMWPLSYNSGLLHSNMPHHHVHKLRQHGTDLSYITELQSVLCSMWFYAPGHVLFLTQLLPNWWFGIWSGRTNADQICLAVLLHSMYSEVGIAAVIRECCLSAHALAPGAEVLVDGVATHGAEMLFDVHLSWPHISVHGSSNLTSSSVAACNFFCRYLNVKIGQIDKREGVVWLGSEVGSFPKSM